MSTRRRKYIHHPGAGGGPPPPPPPPAKQRYNPGWWVVLLNADVYTKAGVSTGIPASADIASSAGVCVSRDWVELEPNGKSDPAGSGPGQRFSGFALIRADLATCATFNGGKGRPYMLRLGVKSFRAALGINPIPGDLQVPSAANNHSPNGYATYDPGSASVPASITAWRWDPTIIQGLMELYAAFGAEFGSNVLMQGINTQETALGFQPDARVDGYTPALYTAALITDSKNIAAASPYFRHYDFINFHPGAYTDAAGNLQHTSVGQGTIYLAQVAAAVQPLGTVLAFPDWVTQGGIVNRVYDIHAAYSTQGTVTRVGTTPLTVTMPGSGPIGGSMQHDELTGNGVGDTPVVPENLFNWGTSQFAYGIVGSAATHKSAAYAGAIDHSPGSSAPGPFVLDFGFVNLTGGDIATHMYPDYPTFGNYVPPSTGSITQSLFVDLNAASGGDGLSSATPTNVLPTTVSDNTAIRFNSDNGIQTVPVRDSVLFVSGNNIIIGSYGSGRAVVSGFKTFNSGWTLVSGTVYKRIYSPASGTVGAVINVGDTSGSPQGTVLNWTNLATPGSFTPASLPVGSYAYDWSSGVTTMYVNIGSNANSAVIGISSCGRFISVPAAAAPNGVEVTNLRIIGFSKAGVNCVQSAANWHIHLNQFYATGGNWAGTTYEGTGVQMANSANGIEVDNNLIEQTFDSPISPQHFGSTSGETINGVHIHHNTITYWALAAVEISDFGTGNTTKNVEVDHNIATGGGQGFSGIGHSVGYTDGVHFRGDPTGTLSGINIHDNTLAAFDAGVAVRNNNASDSVLVTNNRLSSARYGIFNAQPSVTIAATGNSMCANSVNDVHDVNQSPSTLLNGGTYSGNTTQAGACVTPTIPGQGVQ